MTTGKWGHCRSAATNLQRRLHTFATGVAIALALGAVPRAADDAPAAVRRGITALHLFEYEDANEAFLAARRLDPGLVMAYWGEAMTYHQTLWRNENVASGRAALGRLGATPAARLARTRDPKERGYLGAVEVLFGEGDSASRRRGYAEAMAALAGQFPDDPDVAAFHALAQLGTMSRGLIGAGDAHEGHSGGLAGSDTQAAVTVILDRVLRAHPDHAGALHYLLHNDDDPAHASAALGAAQALARLAPDSSHARHMPSHIFLQLGRWEDAALADRAAFAASDAWVARRGLGPALRSYHALAWLQYALLQLGRDAEAWATLDQIAPVVAGGGPLTLLSDLSTMRARYVVETERWDLLAKQTTFGNANELFAVGMSAARGGEAALAERARQGLADRARDPREGDLRPAIAIMEREVAAVAARMAGRGDQAIAILRDAARAEAALPPPLGPPQPIKPAPELLGDLLLELGRGAEAIAPYEQTLQRHPNRTRSMRGLARGKAAAAATAPPAAAPARWLPIAAAAAAIAATAAVVFARRTKKRGPVARAPLPKRANKKP